MTTKPIRNKETECKCKNKFCCTNSNCSANHKKPCNCPNNPLRNKETVKEKWYLKGWKEGRLNQKTVTTHEIKRAKEIAKGGGVKETPCPKCGIELKWWSDERVHEYCDKCGYEKMPTASRLGLISSPCNQATENTKTGKRMRRIIEAELVHAVFPSTPTLGVIQHKEKHIDRMVYILTRSAEHLIEAIRWKKNLSHPLDSITPEFDKGAMFGYNQSISLISDLFDLEGERTVTTTDLKGEE